VVADARLPIGAVAAMVWPVDVPHGGGIPASRGHATQGVVVTVAETLDTGVIFTVEVRVSLSDRPGVRVL
jgi:hypothetical protein